MARIIMDLSEVDSIGEFSVIPAGIYQAQIDATDAGNIRYGKESNTPYITIAFVITEPAEHKGRRLFNNYMLSGKGAFRLPGLFTLLGIMEDIKPGNAEVVADTRDLHGKHVSIRVGVQQNDPERNNILAVMKPTDSIPAVQLKKKTF